MIQRSSRARCSSRAGSAPVQTRMPRRCSTGLLCGISSRAWWVSRRCPLARSATLRTRCSSKASPGWCGPVGAREGLMQRLQPADVAGPSSSSCRSRWSSAHRVQRPEERVRSMAPQLSQRGHGVEHEGRQRRAGRRRCRRGRPGRVRSPSRSPHRFRQAVHEGWPVAVETTQGSRRPQIPQSMIVRGWQPPQSGPPGVAGGDPHAAAANRASLQIDRVVDQAGGA